MTLDGVDILYLRNVIIRLLEAVSRSDLDAVCALLPVVATLLQVPAPEFKRLSDSLLDAAAAARREREARGGAAAVGPNLLGATLSIGGYTLRV
jgi:hypothetical protein